MTASDAHDPAPGTLPELDLARWAGTDADRASLVGDMRRVCHEVGFLQLVGHGVPRDLVVRHVALLEAFFALPEEVKAGIDKATSPHFRGWERVGSELTDNRVDHREQIDLLTEHPARPPGSRPPYLRLDGPNQWLADDVLPGFRATVEELFARLGVVADQVMEVLSVALGLPSHHFRDTFGERPLSLMKLISYPPTPPGEAGVNAHKDAGFVTLLLQHGVGGLQVVGPDGRWIEVPPRDEVLVVNLGEMLQRLSGNYFVATTHRVVAAEPRLSTAYFHGPDVRTRLVPIELGLELRSAVAASPRHSGAGFMARRDELLAGEGGIGSAGVDTYGEMLWNYYERSYPENVSRHHPDLVG